MAMVIAAVTIISITAVATTAHASPEIIADLENTIKELRDRLTVQQEENDALKNENKKLEREFQRMKDLRNNKKAHIAEFTADVRDLIKSESPELLKKYDELSLNYAYERRAQNTPTSESLLTLHQHLNGTLVVGNALTNTPMPDNLVIAAHDIVSFSYDNDDNLVFSKPHRTGDLEFTAYFTEHEPNFNLYDKDRRQIWPNSDDVLFIPGGSTYPDYYTSWFFVKPGEYTFDIDGENSGKFRVISMPTQYIFTGHDIVN